MRENALSPSDLNSFLECEHLVALELQVARGDLDRPRVDNPQANLIRRKGDEHERAYLESLRNQGLAIKEIEFDGRDWVRATAETEQAMRDGFGIVYQAVFANDRWRGIADVLIKQPDGTYEVIDTKLARHAKPYYILQLCFYPEQVARIRGREPQLMHVVLGSGETR